MLRYLKPHSGHRTVWIDAVCINQINTHERNEQVQMMSQIYSQCNQVLLWLGADLVYPTPGTYPSRFPLQNTSLDTEISVAGKPTTLENILKRRYFSRVWVVQELLLAPRVIMPVGNTIFFAHPRTEPGFTESSDHGSSKASSQIPWMKHITRGRVETRGLYQVVGLLGTSQASDARDKVFGVLGLLPSHSDLTTLRPDYSLSQNGVFTGFVAHSIFVEGNHFLLHQACSIDGSPDYPSWAPSYHLLETYWNHVSHKSHTGHPKQEDADRHICATALNMLSESYCNLTRTYCNAWQILAFRSVSIGCEVDRVSRHQDISGHGLHTRVHSDTGRLSINLKRVFAIHEAPVPIDLQSLQGCRVILKMNGSLLNPLVYLIGSKPLHTIVKVGDEVWILETSGNPKVFLILRKNGEPQTFRLVATCYHVFCAFYELVPRDQPLVYDRGVYRMASLCLSIPHIQAMMHWDYEYIQNMFNVQCRVKGMNRTAYRHFLRFILRVSKEDGYEVRRLPRRWESLPGGWKETYVSCFEHDVESWIDGYYCHVRMQQGSGSLTQFESMGWEVVSRGESPTFRREILQIEKEYEMMLSSPAINEYLGVCLSVCRRTYGDFALRDIDILIQERGYGYKDDDKGDKDWGRWLGVADITLGYLDADKSMFSSNPYVPSIAVDSLFRDFELDGSQYRVTIV